MIEPRDDVDAPREGEIVSPGPLAADAALTFVGRIGMPWRARGGRPGRTIVSY